MINHIADANKMVDETPRTTDRVVFIDGNPWVNASFSRGLERELNAANERIKRLEEVGDEVVINYVNSLSAFEMWRKAKEVKP